MIPTVIHAPVLTVAAGVGRARRQPACDPPGQQPCDGREARLVVVEDLGEEERQGHLRGEDPIAGLTHQTGDGLAEVLSGKGMTEDEIGVEDEGAEQRTELCRAPGGDRIGHGRPSLSIESGQIPSIQDGRAYLVHPPVPKWVTTPSVPFDYDLLLYDITSTYFEGQANRNTLAARGYSRDHRSDCKQVCIGLVVSREGFPLGYEVFAGSRRDSTTLQEVVKRMEERYGSAGRIWAVDRGMIDAAHRKWLKERGSKYIVGTPKGELKRFEQELLKGNWQEIRAGLEVRSVPDEAGAETFLLCRSADRAAKEQAMRERFEQCIEKGLIAIVHRCEKVRCSLGVIERRIGRLLGKNTRGARLFSVQVGRDKSGRVVVNWSRRASALESAKHREGCYLLRSNVTEWKAEDLWKAYMQLTEAEAAFRIQKDELRLRPVWHQTAERVQAHILVCFLAYVLRKTLEGWSQRAGLGPSIATLLEEFARIQSTDVVLATTDGHTVRLRCVVRPDKAQTILLHHLGLELPQRLRVAKGVADL
jgi:Transposase DDE domain